MPLDVCTVVFEYNYGQPGTADRGSVWMLPRDGSADLESSAPFAELADWVRITGPIDCELAASIHERLRSFLEGSGVTVVSDGVAD